MPAPKGSVMVETSVPETVQATVLVLDGSNTLSFAAAVDPMRAANRQAGRPLFNWRFATPGDNDITLTSGLRLPAAPLRRTAHCDLLLIVAGFDLERQSTPQLGASLTRLARQGSTIAGIDGGPWIMAHAGVLDGHRATTHWEDLDRFAARFPQLTAQNARFVVSGNRLTSGGAVPGIDMMLHLIEQRFGPALTKRVAGSFIYDRAPTADSPQHRLGPRGGHNALTSRAHGLMEQALDDPQPIAALARQLGLSARALQLQFRARLGTTPQAYYLSLRLAEADRLIHQSDLPLLDVALSTGFNTQSSFARAYRRSFGRPPRQSRQNTPPRG